MPRLARRGTELWHRFIKRLHREIAARAGLTQRALKEVCRVSYGKVAECQKRGAVHFHAVIRIDGPEGPDSPPSAWATTELLTDSIRAAAVHRYASVSVPAAGDQPERTFQWGRQLDIRPVRAFGDGSAITEQAVASYVAKYATKAAETTGTLDRPVGNRSTPGMATPRVNPSSPPPSPATSSSTATPPAKPYATNSTWKEPPHDNGCDHAQVVHHSGGRRDARLRSVEDERCSY